MTRVAAILKCKKCGNDFFYHYQDGEGKCGKCGTVETEKDAPNI